LAQGLDQYLLTAFVDPAENVRKAGAEIVDRMEGPRVMAFAKELSRGENPEARLASAKILSGLSTPEAFDFLVGMLGDDSPSVRREAILGLSKHDSPLAVEWLLPRINDQDTVVSIAAVAAIIARANSRLDSDVIRRAKMEHIVAGVGAQDNPDVIRAILGARPQIPPEVYGACIQRLGKLADDFSIKILFREVCSSGNWALAASALGQIGTRAVFEQVVPMLASGEKSQRIQAMEILQSWGGPPGSLDSVLLSPAMAILSDALRYRDPGIRRSAIRAIGKVGPPGFTFPADLVHDSDSSVRIEIAAALEQVRGQVAEEMLLSLASDDDGEVRNRAGQALIHCGSDLALQALATHPDAAIRALVPAGLAPHKTPSARQLLKQMTEDPNPDVRVEALKALEIYIASGEVRSIVKQRLSDEEETVRRYAIQILAGTVDWSFRRLLSRDLDSMPPWIDPREPIGQEHLKKVSAMPGMTEENARAHYEELRDLLDGQLNLTWA
jgi:HEAT repeat protein